MWLPVAERKGDNGGHSNLSSQAMSQDQFNAFLDAVEANEALQEKVQTEANRYADAVVAIAKEAGFGVTAEDVKRAQLEISEDDLEGVTGGYAWTLGQDGSSKLAELVR